MTAAVLSLISQRRFGARDAGLWTSAAAIVLAAHVAVAYAVQDLSLAAMPDGGPPPALAIELAPLAVAPAIPEESAVLDIATPEPPDATEETEKPVDAKPSADPAPVAERPEPVAELDADTTQEPAPAEQAIAALSEQQPLDDVVPDPVEAIAPDVVIPLPVPKPVEAKVKAQKPAQPRKKPEKKPVEKPKERIRKERAPPPSTTTTASIDARAAAKTSAPKTSETTSQPGISSSEWTSKLSAWFRRHTRYPSAAKPRRAEGTAYVTFTVDPSGRVTSARLTRSSGDPDLDRAALGVLRGNKVPAPPPDQVGQPLTKPMTYVLRD